MANAIGVMAHLPITVDEIVSPSRPYDAAAHQALRKRHTVAVGTHLTLCFESRESVLAHLQSLVALEGLTCPVSLAAECEVAQSAWDGPKGSLAVALALVPRANMASHALVESLASAVQTLCVRIDAHNYPITWAGRASPRRQGVCHLPEAAQQALERPDAQVAIAWAGPAPKLCPVPRALWTRWVAAWAQAAG